MSTSSEVINDSLWIEKYRPKKLEEVGIGAEDRKLLEGYLERGAIPHLLLVGTAGSGKTTIARILIAHLDCQHLTLNASAERGIDTVRDKIGGFVGAMSGYRWNVPFLDEADKLTPDAQTALRNMMENYAKRARFILTANNRHQIIAPIQSRCQVITLNAPPLKQRAKVLISILKRENIAFDQTNVMAYAERYSDMRQLLYAADAATTTRGNGKKLPTLAGGTDMTGEEMLRYLKKLDLKCLSDVAKQPGFDGQTALRDLFYAIDIEDENAGMLMHLIGKGLHESQNTPDPTVLFLATIAHVMEELSARD